MPFMRLHEILADMLDLCKLYLFAHLQSLRTISTVNQQILAAIKFGVSQNKVIWRLFGGY